MYFTDSALWTIEDENTNSKISASPFMVEKYAEVVKDQFGEKFPSVIVNARNTAVTYLTTSTKFTPYSGF
ncbi:MAG: hypothetical protein K2I59_02345, partial [Alistipes sp.]|nr:hypothetical protein [Alistipes sp.]